MTQTTNKTIKSKHIPKQTNVTWIDTSTNPPTTKEFINGIWVVVGGSGGGTDDYADLDNKPQINSVVLSGNKSASDLGLATAAQGAKSDTAVQNITRGGSTLTKTDGVVDIPEEIEEVVATPVAPGGSPSATLSNGTLTLGLVSGSDGHNPNLGTYTPSTISQAPQTNILDGDYIVVVDSTATITKEVYKWDGDSWEPTGVDATDALFASGEAVSTVNIKQDPYAGGAGDVPSAEALKGMTTGIVYDISANHLDGNDNPISYQDLADALGLGVANIPSSVRRPGLVIKFAVKTYQVTIANNVELPSGSSVTSETLPPIYTGTYRSGSNELSNFATLPTIVGDGGSLTYYYGESGNYSSITVKLLATSESFYLQYRYMLSDLNPNSMIAVRNWAGIDDSATYYDLTKIPVAVIDGYLPSNYGFFKQNAFIPSGSFVKNVGNADVVLKESRSGNGENVMQVIKHGESALLDKDYHVIGGDSTGGYFKLYVYADSALINDVNQNKSDIETINTHVSNLDSNVSNLDSKTILGGLVPLSKAMTAYTDWTLPVVLPEHTHIIVELENQTANRIMYLNYDSDNAKTIRITNGYLDYYTEVAVSKIRLSVSCTMHLTIVNENLVLKDNVVGTDNVLDDSITPDKIKGEHIISSNLFDRSSVTAGYIDMTNGRLENNSSLSASDFIEVNPGDYITCMPKSNQYALYDKYKNYVGGGAKIDNTIQIPENVHYIRVSILNSDLDTTMLNVGDTTLPYVQYYHKVRNLDIIGGIDEESFNSSATAKIMQSRLWNGYLTTISASLSNGETLLLNDYPNALMLGDNIVFYANVSSWGNGITIGKQAQLYESAYVTIDSTNITLKTYDSSEHSRTPIPHGLSIQGFVKIIINKSDTGESGWRIIIQTLSDTFVYETSFGIGRGTPRVTSEGASLTDLSFSATNSRLSKPIWMFGDSYFGMSSSNREMYWLKEWGYINTLLQGYGGQDSQPALVDLQRCIAISKPKYIVWCLGMNDPNFNYWKNRFDLVESICNTYGITLILGTIPQPLNVIGYPNRDSISEYIRSSDYRYIDVAKAVGSNAQGQWYGYGETYDYQSTDNVHPSVYGAKAIATQFLIDFPEIMQY